MVLDERGESLLFFRRRLAAQLIRDIMREKPSMFNGTWTIEGACRTAEELAHELTTRLETRETGKVNGYGLKAGE